MNHICDFSTCKKALDDFLDKKALAIKPRVPPALVHYEIQNGNDEIRLSFAIKVF